MARIRLRAPGFDLGAGIPLHRAISDFAADVEANHAYLRLRHFEPIKRGTPHALDEDGRQTLASYRLLLMEQLAGQLRAGALIAKGFLPSQTTPTTIAQELWAEVEVDVQNDTVWALDHVFSGVTVFKPTPLAGSEALPPVVAAARGGRPPTYDWGAFTREVVRFACLDGFNTRLELMKHMTEWCAHNWQDQPSERALQEQVRRHCPEGFPEK